MKKLSFALGLMALAGAGVPGVAAADPVQFETVAKNVMGPFGAAKNEVIRSEQELRDAGLDQYVSSPNVDWNTEMVVAVLMGTRNSGGYSIEVESIEREQLLQILPVPGPPPAYELVVSVRETSPAPGQPVPMVITAPFHIVKLARSSDPVRFEAAGGSGGAGFDAINRAQSTGGINWASDDIRVDAQGDVRYQQMSLTGTFGPVTGKATAAELRALEDAVAAARFHDMPDQLGGGAGTPPVIGFPLESFTYMVEGGPQGDEKVEGGRPVADPDVAARIARVDAALDAIITRVRANDAFETISLETQRFTGGFGPQWPLTQEIRVDKDGAVDVLQSHPTALFAPIRGQATPAEMRALEDAVRAADLPSIPSPLPVVTPMHVQSEPFTLSTTGANAASVSGQYGYYGQWDGRLRPVVDALEAIADRVKGSFGTRELKGTVEVTNGQVEIVHPAERAVVSNAEKADVLRRFRGLDVKVRGRVATNAQGEQEIEVEEILNPQPAADIEATVEEQSGEPVLFISSPFVMTWSPEVVTHGRARHGLRLAVGERASLRAWLFTDANGVAREAYVEHVDGTSDRFSVLRTRGHWTGFARPGQDVEVLGLTRSGDYAYVRATGRGYVHVSRIDVGHPIPLHSPTGGGGAPTTGLAGAVSAAGE